MAGGFSFVTNQNPLNIMRKPVEFTINDVRPDRIIPMSSNQVEVLLKRVLNIKQGVNGMPPSSFYAEKLNSISTKFRFDKKHLSASEEMDRIRLIREEISLLDMYFIYFIEPHLQEGIEQDLSAAEEVAQTYQG